MGFKSGGGFTSGRSDLDSDLTIDGSVKIKEGTAADSDVAGQGQLWVKNDSPNNLYFTDDAGNDVQITSGGTLAAAGGTLAGLGSTNNAILRANGTGGETAKGSGVTIDDSNNVASMGTLACGAITTSGVLDITDTTDASDATGDSGALRTEGGASIAKKLYVGTNLDVDGVANLDNTDIDGTLVVDGSEISLDSTGTLNIDNSDTSNGITIGTATSAVPISIGHSVSETTVNDNLTVTGDLAINGASTTLTSGGANEPVLHITNTRGDGTSGELRFNKDTPSGDDDDVMGLISFYGTDSGNNTHERLAYMDAIITDAADGSEAASLRFYVAENDATLTRGLLIAGQADHDGEVDVTLGAGTGSETTIAGILKMGSTAAMTNAGLLSVGNQSNVTGTGALDSGSITSGFGNIDIGSSSLAAGSLDVSDGNITNVGDIALDSISADGNDINVAVSDNRSTAFTIKQGTDAYLIVDTGDSSESVSIGTGISGTAITIGHATSETTVSDNLTVTGDLNVNGDTAAFSSANANNPLIQLENTTDDVNGPRLRFINNRGAAGVNGDEAGEIQFESYNNAGTPEKIQYARIKAKIADKTDGAEGGQLTLQVASHNGSMTNGLKLVDGNASGEVDVEIGAGALSVTEIKGLLKLGDDKKLIFGDATDGDATIEYDEDGTDTLSISGAATKFTVAGVEIENASDSGAAALLIDNDDVDQIALDVDGANTTANIVDITATALTSGKALSITATGGACKEAVKLTHSYSDTTAVTSVPGICPLHIDFDKTGASTGADKMTGLFIDMDNTTADAGDILMRGLLVTPTLQLDANHNSDPVVIGGDFEVTGHTNGIDSVARGLDITVTGADFNQGIHIKSSVGGSGTSPTGNHLKLISGGSDGNHAQISVMANGETLIKTNDSSAAAAHLHILADGNLTLDAEADIIFDAKGNDFNFKADGTEVLRISNSSQDVVIKPTVQEKDIIFQNSDNEECARIVDASADASETAPITNTIPLAPGLGFNKPSLLISAADGNKAVTLTPEISGYLILLSPGNNDIAVTLPAITSDALVGIHYEFVLIAPLQTGKTVTIKTAGAGSDDNDNFFLYNTVLGTAVTDNGTTGNTSPGVTFDSDGDTLTIPATSPAGAIIECTALTADYDPGSAGTLEEVWLAKSISQLPITCTDT